MPPNKRNREEGQTLYEKLGVSEIASAAEISSAFRKLALYYHPDRHRHLTIETQTKREAVFKVLNEACQILRDSVRRAEYDQSLADARASRPEAEHDRFRRRTAPNVGQPSTAKSVDKRKADAECSCRVYTGEYFDSSWMAKRMSVVELVGTGAVQFKGCHSLRLDHIVRRSGGIVRGIMAEIGTRLNIPIESPRTNKIFMVTVSKGRGERPFFLLHPLDSDLHLLDLLETSLHEYLTNSSVNLTNEIVSLIILTSEIVAPASNASSSNHHSAPAPAAAPASTPAPAPTAAPAPAPTTTLSVAVCFGGCRHNGHFYVRTLATRTLATRTHSLNLSPSISSSPGRIFLHRPHLTDGEEQPLPPAPPPPYPSPPLRECSVNFAPMELHLQVLRGLLCAPQALRSLAFGVLQCVLRPAVPSWAVRRKCCSRIRCGTCQPRHGCTSCASPRISNTCSFTEPPPPPPLPRHLRY